MARFLLRRIISSVLTLLAIITITFFLMHMVPGGPFNSEKMDPVTQANLEKKYGLDKPVIEQYGIYLGNIAQLDLGPSLKLRGRTVNSIISEKFPVSARLGGMTLVFAVIIGVSLGIAAALKHESIIDRLIMLFTTFGISVPGFVVGTLLLVVFGALLNIAPTTWSNNPVNYILPIITYSFYPICFVTKLTRSSMLETLGQDYIKTARAKGLASFAVNYKHALKNSIIPVITYLGPLTAYLITGGFAVEKIFSIPGLGRFFIDSISNRDYPLIMGTTIFLAILVIGINMIVDILYTVVDPRIKLK
ncbi:MAG: ABC transporter permease [Eubacteriales bacterium]|nr:ABC transporter permease [Eubacteriales bacterium]MDD3197812.1 ABC transporter permease [Eubacteriales bacterium]MDD3504710.1 ABC transporter permease [Eubacteriales bacterium]MDD4682126.1 ABC transporter permease [Eubacteriales bacterium]